MVFIRKSLWILGWLLAIACVLTLGIFGYRQMMGIAGADIKTVSERFLYLSLVFCVALCAVGLGLLAMSRNLLTSLDRRSV